MLILHRTLLPLLVTPSLISSFFQMHMHGVSSRHIQYCTKYGHHRLFLRECASGFLTSGAAAGSTVDLGSGPLLRGRTAVACGIRKRFMTSNSSCPRIAVRAPHAIIVTVNLMQRIASDFISMSLPYGCMVNSTIMPCQFHNSSSQDRPARPVMCYVPSNSVKHPDMARQVVMANVKKCMLC